MSRSLNVGELIFFTFNSSGFSVAAGNSTEILSGRSKSGRSGVVSMTTGEGSGCVGIGSAGCSILISDSCGTNSGSGDFSSDIVVVLIVVSISLIDAGTNNISVTITAVNPALRTLLVAGRLLIISRSSRLPVLGRVSET